MSRFPIRCALYATLLTLATATTAHTQEATSRIPDFIPAPSRPTAVAPEGIPQETPLSPIWVSEQYLREMEGDFLTNEIFADYDRIGFAESRRVRDEAIQEAQKDGDLKEVRRLKKCAAGKYSGGGCQVRNDSLDSLFAGSVMIVRGHIRERKEGLLYATPSSLLVVEIDKTLYRAPEQPVMDDLLIAYPYAEFDLPAGYLFCMHPHHTLPVPEPQDGIIFFVFPIEGTTIPGQVYGGYYADQHVFFVSSATGQLSLPDELSEDPRLRDLESLDQVEAVLLRMRGGQ